MFDKLLVANRGEIALRVMRTCRELGLRSVAVYSDADRTSPHVLYADEAYRLGPAPSAESYLRIDRLLEVAQQSGARAVHPGYGFLAENADFAEACEQAGLVFVGPPSGAMRLLGSKIQARRAMLEAGVPVIPGMESGARDAAEGLGAARAIGLPVILKASAGGGGKGMRIVDDESTFESDFAAARAEAEAAFGDPTVYVEKHLSRPRHVEFQILADRYGQAVHLNERECSIQRRHQKLIEECPSPFLSPELRARMGEVAVRAALAAGYTNAGTVEFLVDEDQCFYFLEVNARLQVEHPVTELVTGLDLVKEQLRIAWGEPLGMSQADIPLRGAAIEARICAEDPYADFVPSLGEISHLREPAGPGVRVDSGLSLGQELSVFYDPLVAKLICWGQDRPAALDRMQRALGEYEIAGVKSTIPFHRHVMADERFRQGDFDTSYVQERWQGDAPERGRAEIAALVAALVHGSSPPGPRQAVREPQRGADPWRRSVAGGVMRGSRAW